MTIFAERIQQLRQLMKDKLDAYVVHHTDPHQSEYPIEHYLERVWISGFTGSAGSVVITEHAAGLWTDARYYLQAEKELKGSGIELFKVGSLDTPTIEQWLSKELEESSSVGINPLLFTVVQKQAMLEVFKEKNITLHEEYDLIKQLWITNRPSPSLNPILIHGEQWSGESISSKVEKIKKELKTQRVDGFLISTLDEVAWTFNIRGTDTPYNPVAIAYGYVGLDETVLFTQACKVNAELKAELKKHHVKLASYEEVFKFLKQKTQTKTVGYDPTKTSVAIEQVLNKAFSRSINNPITPLKGVKNRTEIAGFREAMIYEGVALTHFFQWLEQALNEGIRVTEIDVMTKLHEFRSLCPHFKEESFATIAAFGAHGAIIHYHATETQNIPLEQNSFFLLDSGGQYSMGTTDITRTIHLGEPRRDEKKDFTLVLKANINLTRAIFPDSARGVNLDSYARRALWIAGLDFPHGTGHGIGSCLNVHEGPQSIRGNVDNGVRMASGMVTSNEPGVYRTGKYGIRIENIILCKPYQITEFGNFLCFETLTLFPIDKKSIDPNLLSQVELEWLNDYHERVFNHLSPHLDEKSKLWLRTKCSSF